MATLKIYGQDVTAAEATELLDSTLHRVQKDHVVAIGAERAGARPIEIPDAQPDDLVELHLDDGAVVVTTYERLREQVRKAPGQRGADPDSIPAFLDLGEAERGAGTVGLRLLRLFRVEPETEIADLATAKAVEKIEERLAGAPGLYRLAADGLLGPRVTAPLAATAGGEPLLVLLHGAASSTMGSFAGLFGERPGGRFAPSAEWRALRERYGDRIYALEHHTLSVSPARNALDLAGLLPAGAEVHLVSHSRGGLVGELLCRGGFGPSELAVFRRGDRELKAPGELALLADLGTELAQKQLRVERFVRVACPAAGTVLASDRLDLFLSVLLSLLRLAVPPLAEPVLELLKATLLEVARRRADPEELPGLEAQRPESPYSHFLNRPQASVDQDLCVIAGDLRRGSVLQSLRALVGYGFFWQKNDLVVHTRAMYAGLPREQSWVSYHEGSAVTHFSYFREAPSRAHLLAALLRPERATKPEGFQGLREALDKQSFSALRELPRPDREKRAVTGTVLFLPDLFGTRLGADGTEVWPSTAAITQGGLGSLQSGAPVTVQGLVDASPLAALAEALGGDQAIEPVPYDWRGGSVEAARALAQALARRKKGAPPVAVVAHGLGALGVLELLRETSGSAGEDPLHAVPLLLVAPPLKGAEAALLLWLGEGRLFAMLKCLDGEATASDIAGLLQGLPGIAELLPDRALDPAWWERAGVTAPDPALLAAIARRRAEHVKLAVGRTDASFLLGAAEATPAVTFADRRRIESGENGDGWMVNPVSLLPEARVWFAPALHERVLLHPLGAATAADVLRSGTSARGSRQPPKDRPRRQPPPFVFPSQADLEGELVAADAAGEPGREWVLHAQVAHGSLDRLEGRPLLVGHYDADGIWGAEAFLDRCVEGRLGHRHRLGNYPGPAGTATYVPAPGCHPEGALVVGLGDVGDLTAGRLSQGVERAVIERALHAIDARTDRFDEGVEAQRLPLASLLIGTRGGLLTLRQSMVAVLRGVLRARRALARAGLDRFVTLDDVAFVELWSDIAIAAGHALQEVDDDAGLGREPGEHVLPAPTLKVMEGARGNSPSFAGEWSWWRRIIISEEPDGGARGGLQFVTLGERSRAEERMVFTQRPLVDELIARAPKEGAAIADGGLVNALFELLLPVPLKETVYEGRDLVLVVDRRSGRYPWELLARRSAAGIEPLVSRVRLVRQFRTDAFREVVAPARSDHALVIGEPDLGDAAVTGFPPLEGARLEAEAVVEELKRRSYSVESSVGEGGHQIIQKLFLRDYRVLHVAAHGDYHADRPEASGVIIGRNADGSLSVLSADLFRQLRAIPELVFLNCCHLGRLDQPGAAAQGLQSDADRTRLAASVAEAVMGLGVRCLVVAGWAVNDRAAHAFAREFYRRMLRGETVGDAVHQARCAVWKDYARTTTWGAYQCYGDPSFRLRSPRGANGGPRSFVSARELVGAVTDVTAAASATGSSAAYCHELQQRLRGVETFLANHEDWRSGELLHEMAEAWKATGDFQRAVGLYRAALLARDAGAPLKSAEQLCNLLDRLEREGKETPAGDTPLELAAQAEERPRAVVWLEWVERVAQTPERASLRGGILKRAAQRATPRDRPALLAAAASAYELAVELRRRQDDTVHYYPGLNVAALRWARGLSRDRAARTKLIADYVAPSRRSAREEAAEGRTLWNAIALPEADLLEALILGELDAARAKALAGRFERVLRNLGTPTEHLSARRQVEFLAALAVGQRAPARRGLDTIFAAFPKE